MTTKIDPEQRAAALFVGAAERLTEGGLGADVVCRALFAAAFAMSQRLVPNAEIVSQLQPVLDALAEIPDDDEPAAPTMQ